MVLERGTTIINPKNNGTTYYTQKMHKRYISIIGPTKYIHETKYALTNACGLSIIEKLQ